jgi:uncharacterized protein (DUF2267 family)
MITTGIDTFDTTVQKTNHWLRELSDLLGWQDDKPLAYRALRAVLHVLRDRLILEEAVELGAQLPMLVRGFYYEGWRPADTPTRERKREEFLARVEERLRPDPTAPEDATRAVFKLLAHRISEGELQDVRHMLPQEVRALMPEIAAGAGALR